MVLLWYCPVELSQHQWWEIGRGDTLNCWCCLPRSVLIHLLPGLALFAHRHCRAPEPVVQVWQYLWGPPPADVAADAPVSFFWISAAPLLFYAAWQLMYFIIVQVSSPRSYFLGSSMVMCPCNALTCSMCSS